MAPAPPAGQRKGPRVHQTAVPSAAASSVEAPICPDRDLAALIPLRDRIVTLFGVILPFVGLALFPGALRKLPKSGGWLNAVKVVMGFIEVAAAFKFLRGADLYLQWGIFSRSLVLSVWIACSLGAALYLLAPHGPASSSEEQSLYLTPSVSPEGVGLVFGGKL